MIDYKSQISVSFKVTIAGATVKPIVFYSIVFELFNVT